MNRLTDCNKWKDTWFSELSPNAKLLFIFIVENCDNAGIYEINKKFMLVYLNLKDDELAKAVTELRKCYVKSKDEKFIWVKNFLKHQKKLPLNESNKVHKQIISIIKDAVSKENRFSHCKEMIELLPENVFADFENKTKSKPKKTTHDVEEKPTRFVKPSQQEVADYMRERNFNFYNAESVKFCSYFESNGWKVGKNTMKSWQGAVITWISNFNERNKLISAKINKLESVKESHESLDGVDWNEIYK
jgi:hypothetical protein